MVSLEDIPKIPEGQDVLRVEVERVIYGDSSSFVLTRMYYFIRNSRMDPDGVVIALHESLRDDGSYQNLRVFNLEDISKIQPLTYRE